MEILRDEFKMAMALTGRRKWCLLVVACSRFGLAPWRGNKIVDQGRGHGDRRPGKQPSLPYSSFPPALGRRKTGIGKNSFLLRLPRAALRSALSTLRSSTATEDGGYCLVVLSGRQLWNPAGVQGREWIARTDTGLRNGHSAFWHNCAKPDEPAQP